MTSWRDVWQFFRFIHRWRIRVETERAAERAHQTELLQLFLQSLETIQENSSREAGHNAEALIKVAEAMSKQAEGFAEWMKLFQTTSAPTSSVVTDEDEYQAEQVRALEAGLPADIAALPEEYRMAYALAHDPNFLNSE